MQPSCTLPLGERGCRGTDHHGPRIGRQSLGAARHQLVGDEGRKHDAKRHQQVDDRAGQVAVPGKRPGVLDLSRRCRTTSHASSATMIAKVVPTTRHETCRTAARQRAEEPPNAGERRRTARGDRGRHAHRVLTAATSGTAMVAVHAAEFVVFQRQTRAGRRIALRASLGYSRVRCRRLIPGRSRRRCRRRSNVSSIAVGARHDADQPTDRRRIQAVLDRVLDQRQQHHRRHACWTQSLRYVDAEREALRPCGSAESAERPRPARPRARASIRCRASAATRLRDSASGFRAFARRPRGRCRRGGVRWPAC